MTLGTVPNVMGRRCGHEVAAAELRSRVKGELQARHLRDGFLAIHDLEEIALDLAHAVSAEHGVGKIKAGFLETMYGHEAMVESARLKLQLDPAGQLGRGNLFSEKLLDELVQKGGA